MALAAANWLLLGDDEGGATPPKATKHASSAPQSHTPAVTSLIATR
jgi:hypothetical protein